MISIEYGLRAGATSKPENLKTLKLRNTIHLIRAIRVIRAPLKNLRQSALFYPRSSAGKLAR
jgi:hypothetical protein